MNKCAFCDNEAAEGFGLCEQCLWNDWLEHQPAERTPPKRVTGLGAFPEREQLEGLTFKPKRNKR